MSDKSEWVSELVSLNRGSLAGKTRLQKTVYLLEVLGLGAGFDFDYHNYGPYSADLSFAADDAVGLGLLETEEKEGQYEIPYLVYKSANKPIEGDQEVQAMLAKIDGYSSIVLELAATAVFLDRHGYKKDPWSEVARRKPSKAAEDRLLKAKRLLNDLSIKVGG